MAAIDKFSYKNCCNVKSRTDLPRLSAFAAVIKFSHWFICSSGLLSSASDLVALALAALIHRRLSSLNQLLFKECIGSIGLHHVLGYLLDTLL